MLTIAYSAKSKPTATTLAETLNNTELVRDSTVPVDINWGRYRANARLNPDIRNTTNKRRMRELFAEHGVPTPKLYGVNHAGVLEFPCVGRPDNHMKKRGFWKCYGMADALLAMRGTRRKKAATHFIEYIEHPDNEYRVHIFKGKSIRISEKDFTEYSDGRYYTTRRPTCSDEIRQKLRDAAKRAVEAVKLDFGAVDILVKGDKVYVLEVNAAPGLGGSMPRVYAEAFTKWKEAQ